MKPLSVVRSHHTSLMLLKHCPFRASFTFGKRGVLVTNLAVRGMLDHTEQFRSKKLLHIQCAVSGRIVV